MAIYNENRISDLMNALRNGKISRRDFMKTATLLVGVASASAFLASCGVPPTASTDRIRLGMMTTLSGIGSIHAPPTINAANQAVSEINAAGGLLGKQVDLLLEDNHTDVDIAVQKGLRLVQDQKVAAFIDFGFSNSRFAVAEKVALAYKTIMLSPIFYEGGICNRYFFNISALPNQGIDPFVPWLMKNRNAKKFYAIGSAYAWGIGSDDAVVAAVAANNGQFLGREESPLGTTDWSAIIQHLKAAAPDVCFVFVAGDDLVTFLKQFNDFGLYGKIQLAFTYFTEEDTPTIATAYRPGHLSANTWFLSYKSPESTKFLDGYYKEAGKGTLVTMFGEGTYDAIHMWAQAVQKAGTIETEKVVDALEGLSYLAPQGKITIDPVTHHAAVRCLIAESTADPNNFNILADLGIIPPKPPKACNADSIK